MVDHDKLKLLGYRIIILNYAKEMQLSVVL